MSKFEYKVVPAPSHGTKAKGVKSTEDRFALSLTEALNEAGAEGWEYVRAETLPCDERKGLTGTQTTYQNMLIYRRAIEPVERAAPAARQVSETPKLPPLELRTPSEPRPERSDPPLSRFRRELKAGDDT